eukprot:1529110-Lingulodinium_polyedra.AAC.1
MRVIRGIIPLLLANMRCMFSPCTIASGVFEGGYDVVRSCNEGVGIMMQREERRRFKRAHVRKIPARFRVLVGVGFLRGVSP